MKKTFILSILLTSLFFSVSNAENKKNDLTKKHIEEQLKKEQKFKREQAFYHGENYNLKEAEIDERSVESIPENRDDNDSFDMDSVYD